MGYDRDDSFSFDFEPNGIPFGSKSKEKLLPQSYPIQYEREWKYSFRSVYYAIRRSFLVIFLKQILATTYCKYYAQYYFSKGIIILIILIYLEGSGVLHIVKWDKACEVLIIFLLLCMHPHPSISIMYENQKIINHHKHMNEIHFFICSIKLKQKILLSHNFLKK